MRYITRYIALLFYVLDKRMFFYMTFKTQEQKNIFTGGVIPLFFLLRHKIGFVTVYLIGTLLPCVAHSPKAESPRLP